MEILYRAMLRLNNEPSVLGLSLQMHQDYWRLNIHYIDYAKHPKGMPLIITSEDANAEQRLEYFAKHGFDKELL